MGLPFFKKKKDTSYDLTVPERSSDNHTLSEQDKAYDLEKRKIDAFNSMVEANREANNNDYDIAKSKIDATMQLGTMVGKTINNVADVWRTSMIIEKDIASINSKTTIELAKIASDYNKFQTALGHIFGERSTALQVTYATLDKALKENDRELIIHSLRSVSDIVTSRPLEDFDKFMEDWDEEDNTKPFELGF